MQQRRGLSPAAPSGPARCWAGRVREPPLADELLDEAVVLRDATDHAFVDDVSTRIADVADQQLPAAFHDQRGQGRAHAGEAAVASRPLDHCVVRSGDRILHAPAGGDRRAQGFDGGPAGDLAPAVPAHAVGDGEQYVVLVDQERVLVVAADETGV